ncbi:metal ion binding protein [Dorcoceras hygrometricum]|nr:metal ion binding protein [Dorcoceras hygrometricum]
MASVSAFSFSKPNHSLHISSSSTSTTLQFHFQFQPKIPPISCIYSIPKSGKCNFRRPTRLRALAEEEETLVPQQESPSPAVTSDQTVSVSVSPSDILTMFFQAEGAMADSAIPTVTKALEVIEGITDLKVQISEGIASVELTKQTTVQATGVASNLVEIIQGSGFKLQTLNLSFQDEEDFY